MGFDYYYVEESESYIFYRIPKILTVYTRDPAVMRKLDALVIEFPEVYRCIGATDIDKTYEMPKLSVTYRKPRKLSEEQRAEARIRMQKINNA